MLMKKYVSALFIIFFFIIALVTFPRNISAQGEPVLLNDGVSDFFVTNIGGDPKPVLDKEDIVSVLVEAHDDPVSYGTRHTFSLNEDSLVAVRILLDEYEDYDTEPYKLKGLAFYLINPSGSVYTIQAKSLLVLHLSDPGEYTIQLEGSTIGFYTLDAFRIRSPYLSSVTFIGTNFPFQGYETVFNHYVLSGGVGIIYSNTDALEYIDVKQINQLLTINESYEVTKSDLLFDNYISNGDEITLLESMTPVEVIKKYRDHPMLVKVQGSSAVGGILVVSPTLTILEKTELSSILQEAGTEIKFFEEETAPMFTLSQKLAFVFLVLLLLAIFYVTVGKLIIHSFQDEQYLSTLLKNLEERKATIRKLTFIINLSVLLPLSFFIIFLIFLWEKISQWLLQLGSYQAVPDLSFFYENYTVGEALEAVLIPIIGIVMIDAAIIIWLQWKFIIETRDFLSKSLFGWMQESLRKPIMKALWYAVALSSLLFVYISAFHSSDILLVSFSIVVTVIAGFFYLSSMQRKISFSPLEKRMGTIMKVLLIAAPILYFSMVVYTLLSPFGINQKYHFREEIFDHIGSINPQFYTNYQGGDFAFSYNPYSQKNNVSTNVGQTLSSTDSIYLRIDNPADRSERFLFFDQDLSEFPKVNSVDDLYFLSRARIDSQGDLGEVIKKEVPVNSYIGLDETVYNSTMSNGNSSSFNFSDYYREIKMQRGKTTVTLDVQGSLAFYTVLKDNVVLDITYERTSFTVGRDEFIVRVVNEEGSAVVSEFVEDENAPLYADPSEKRIRLEKEGLEEGVYHIEIFGFDETASFATVSDDIVFQNLTINSKHLVIDTFYSNVSRFVMPKTLYYKPMETETFVTQSMPSEYLVREECSVLGLKSDTNVTAESDYSEVGLRLEEQEISAKNMRQLSFSCSLGKVYPSYNFYSFTKDSYFYPFKYYFTEIDSIDTAVISRSNLVVKQKEDGYYSSTVDLGLWDYEFRKPVLFTFSIKGNPLRYTGFHVKDFELTLKTDD